MAGQDICSPHPRRPLGAAKNDGEKEKRRTWARDVLPERTNEAESKDVPESE